MPQLHGKQIRDASIENVKLLRPATRVRAKSTGNITIAAPGAAIDGVTLSVNDRVALGDQTTTTEDGVYEFQGAATPMTRAPDFPVGAAVAACPVFVSEGTVNNDTQHIFSNNTGSDVVGTDDLVLVDITGTGALTGGDGIDISVSDVISVDLSAISGLKFTTGTLEVDSDTETGGDIRGVNLTANGVGLDVDLIDGVGIEADGSAQLQISAQGDGLSGGGGTTIAVQADGDTITVGAGGVKSTKLTTADKAEAPAATSGDDVDTTLTIAATPVGDRYIQVFVNGLKVEVGEALKTKDCFFSDTASTPFTALALSAITAGSKLIWNGVVAGYDLATTDRIDLDYEIVA